MIKIKNALTKLSALPLALLTLVLFVNANTVSSGLIYQPKLPKDLNKFQILK